MLKIRQSNISKTLGIQYGYHSELLLPALVAKSIYAFVSIDCTIVYEFGGMAIIGIIAQHEC